MQYFKWEGIDTYTGQPRTGVIKAPGDYLDKTMVADAETSDWVHAELRRRRVRLVWWQAISAEAFHGRRLATWRLIGGAIGLAGCSAASLLLPVPVAIWAASAFAALTATAAVPP